MIRPATFPLVYRPTLAGRIALFLLGLPLTAMGLLPFLIKETKSPSVSLFVILIVTALMGVFLIGQALVSKIIFDRETLSLVNIFSTKNIERRKISGYRRNKHTLVFYTGESGGRGFTVPTSYKYDETFNGWLSGLRNLNEEDEKSAAAQVDSDDRYGPTLEDRRRKLTQLRRITVGSSFVGFGSVLWAMLYPHPVWLAIGFPIVLPGIALLVVASSNGLITFYELDKVEAKKKGLLMGLLTAPTMALALTLTRPSNGMAQWPDEFGTLVVAGVIGGVVLTYLMSAVSKPAKSNAWVWVGTAPYMMLHVAASMAMLNGLTDTATPQTKRFIVQGKHHTTGKGATYWLETAPESSADDITHAALKVSPALYFKEQVNDTVCQRVHPGSFHLTWTSIDDCA